MTDKMQTTDFSKHEKQAYSYLQDDISKNIFCIKLEYSKNKTLSCIEDIRDYTSDYIRELPAFVVKDMNAIPFIDGETVVFYGAGTVCGFIVEETRILRGNVNTLVCDRDAENIKYFHGYNTITPDDLFKNHKNARVIITSPNYCMEIHENLVANGIMKDNISRLALFDINNQFFDEVIKFSNNEVFVDIGTISTHSILNFAERCKNYKEIHIFQQNEIFTILINKKLTKNNIKNVGIYNTDLCDSSDSNKLDYILNDTEATFIKIDTEGNILNILYGAENIIKKNKPKFAISLGVDNVNVDDIIMCLKNILSEYKFYIRNYSTNLKEIVLYAIM